MQIAAGAIGVTCAKLGEAEVMAAAGVRDILIANQIVGPIKIGRLVRLADACRPDRLRRQHRERDRARCRIPQTPGKPLRVAIEVDIGMNRAGVAPGPAGGGLRAARSPGIAGSAIRRRGGAGRARPRPSPTQRRRSAPSARPSQPSSPALERARQPATASVVVSCGGTGTFPYCAQQPGVTEVEVGGAIFSDMHYLTHYHVDFAPALTVLTTVTSRPTPTRIIVDAGRKTMSGDAAMPAPRDLPPVSPGQAFGRAHQNRAGAARMPLRGLATRSS